MSAEARQLCTFMVDGLQFAVDVQSVQEVIRHQEITPVPLVPEVVRGLINLRGQIVTALDMRVRLNLAARGPDTPIANVIVRRGAGAVSLLVDEIGDVLEVSEADYQPTPETLPASIKELIDGVYKLSPLLMLLDTERVVRLDETKLNEE